MICMSVRASPGPSAPFQCHCSQRLLLTSEPSSSAKQVVGRRNTSVWMLAVDVVELAGVAPELGGFGGQRVHDHQPLELGQRRADAVLVRQRGERVEALAHVAVDLALVHQLEHAQHVVAGLSSLGR
jgi:hypothetical protein